MGIPMTTEQLFPSGVLRSREFHPGHESEPLSQGLTPPTTTEKASSKEPLTDQSSIRTHDTITSQIEENTGRFEVCDIEQYNDEDNKFLSPMISSKDYMVFRHEDRANSLISMPKQYSRLSTCSSITETFVQPYVAQYTVANESEQNRMLRAKNQKLLPTVNKDINTFAENERQVISIFDNQKREEERLISTAGTSMLTLYPNSHNSMIDENVRQIQSEIIGMEDKVFKHISDNRQSMSLEIGNVSEIVDDMERKSYVDENAENVSMVNVVNRQSLTVDTFETYDKIGRIINDERDTVNEDESKSGSESMDKSRTEDDSENRNAISSTVVNESTEKQHLILVNDETGSSLMTDERGRTFHTIDSGNTFDSINFGKSSDDFLSPFGINDENSFDV